MLRVFVASWVQIFSRELRLKRIVRSRIRRARGGASDFSIDAAAINRIFPCPSARIFPASATSPGPARRDGSTDNQRGTPSGFLHEELPDTTRMAPPQRRRKAVRAARAESVRLQFRRPRASHGLHHGRPRVGTSGITGIIEPNDPKPRRRPPPGLFRFGNGRNQESGIRSQESQTSNNAHRPGIRVAAGPQGRVFPHPNARPDATRTFLRHGLAAHRSLTLVRSANSIGTAAGEVASSSLGRAPVL